ncbi:hypothetical protein V8C40DRAFT_206452 [Trichoderma camerunense]
MERQTVFDRTGVIVIPGCKRRGRLVATLIHHEPSMAMRHNSILGILSFFTYSLFIPSLLPLLPSLSTSYGGVQSIIFGINGRYGITLQARCTDRLCFFIILPSFVYFCICGTYSGKGRRVDLGSGIN